MGFRCPAELGQPGGDRRDVDLSDQDADGGLPVLQLGGDPGAVCAVEPEALVVQRAGRGPTVQSDAVG